MDQEFVDSRITELAQRCPGKTAIRSEEQSVSYLELEKKSNRIANFMYSKIAEIHNVIIILDRSPELIESIIGLLKCGLVFVPLDPLFPPNRVKRMIEDTRLVYHPLIMPTISGFKSSTLCSTKGAKQGS